jgi:Flp pilus assembly protein TadG
MRRKKGQALIEIALVLPILLVIICGIADFGRIFYSEIHLNMISQDAVRMAGLGSTDQAIVQFVNNNVLLGDKDTLQVTVIPNDLTRKSGDFVTVKITYKVKYITPLMNKILPSPFAINTQSTIRVE